MICVPWWVFPLVALLGGTAMLGIQIWYWKRLYDDVWF